MVHSSVMTLPIARTATSLHRSVADRLRAIAVVSSPWKTRRASRFGSGFRAAARATGVLVPSSCNPTDVANVPPGVLAPNRLAGKAAADRKRANTTSNKVRARNHLFGIPSLTRQCL